jgi:N-acyl-D-amino-acid deacylase
MNGKTHRLILLLATSLCGGSALAQLPVSGRPVPAFTALDTVMSSFMSDPSRDITAGVLGISRGGRAIFLRGYGRLRNNDPLPETALFRIASVAKPITAAAIQDWVARGGAGANGQRTPAFNLGGNGGLLNAGTPPGGLGDTRFNQITLGHLLNHSAGWDRNPPGVQPFFWDFPILRVRDAGIAMNEPDALPTRPQLLTWALQFPLFFAPGANTYTAPGSGAVTPGPNNTYSNFGYLVLGEILEQRAFGGYLGYLGGRILSPQNWVPSVDWGLAATPESGLDAREPAYVDGETGSSVWDYTDPVDQLPLQYGGYHLETMMAHGGLVASAQAMLRFGQLYAVNYTTTGSGGTQSNLIGSPLGTNGIAAGLDTWHTGRLPGTSTVLRQLGRGAGTADDTVIYIAFNRRGPGDWALDASTLVIAALNGIAQPWPTAECDGFWVALGAENPAAGHGGYHATFQGFQSALSRAGQGAKLRLRSGSQAWTGQINQRLILDAPEGPVLLGRSL